MKKSNFDILLNQSQNNNADYLATGHYAQIKNFFWISAF